MENKNDSTEREVINNEEVEVEETTATEDKETETEKQTESPEARVSRLKRELKRAQQKLGVEEETEVKPKTKQFVLDRADKAFLNANGIKGVDEYELVTSMVKNTGKDIEELIENKFFLSELKDVRQTRESRMASDAASGNNRNGNSARDTVEYWVNKGQLPPPYMTKLRREVVNAKIKNDKGGSNFTNNSVIS